MIYINNLNCPNFISCVWYNLNNGRLINYTVKPEKLNNVRETLSYGIKKFSCRRCPRNNHQAIRLYLQSVPLFMKY